jgi:histidinol-phosphate phosphatase family protein
MKQLVILAGGKGTRLSERLGDLPKPLIDVCGVPLLERQILLAKRYDFERVLILVNYRAEAIVQFCHSKDNWGLDIQCINDGEPRGTAGAVLQVIDHLEDEFLLMYGDTMLEVDLQRFHQYHAADFDAAATLFLHPNDHPHDSDLVDIDECGNIVGFYPYPHDPNSYFPNLVNAALYWIRKPSLLPWIAYSNGVLDFAKQLFPVMLKNGYQLRGYKSPEYIKDCGTPKRIDKVCADFISGKISRASLDYEQMAVFLDRDGTINREVNHLNSVEQFELLPGVENAIRRLNQFEYRVCVVTNQPVIARGECSPQALCKIHNKMETLLGREGAFVDQIVFCPHHPDNGYKGEVPELKIDCHCRKPKTGMIDALVSDLNIARSRSWMIGDTTADILTGRNAGLKSILVETGYGGLDGKYWITPDFIVPDLASGISFILDIYPALTRAIEPLTVSIQPGDVVFIGGQSRSGKSSLSSVMRDVLESRGFNSHIISTDRWLLNEAERGTDVLSRHDAIHINEMMASICDASLRPNKFFLPGYRKSRRENISNIETINVLPLDIVIFEGVVALHFAELLKARHRYFVEIDESVRKERVIREYKIRGYSNENAEAIYLERFLEEVPWVAKTGLGAVHLQSL